MTSPAPTPPPPLTRWGVIWRNIVAIGIGGIVWSTVAKSQWEEARPLFYIDIAFGVASLVAMQFRRRWPVAMALFTTAASAVSATSSGAGTITFISMATRRRWVEILPLAFLGVAAGQIYGYVQPDQAEMWWFTLAFGSVVVAVSTATGMYIGARRELLTTLRDRAERAEREQALRVAQAQASERTRIAREMHDVLAHRMSLVAMHAGALTYRDNLTADETRETAEIIQANSHRALTDLREILGVLRDEETDSAPQRPQPTLCDVDELVADERAAGAKVRLTNDLPREPEVPQWIGRTAYRVIQEGLTNARKHAPDTRVDITVDGSPHAGLTVEVRNPMRVGRTTDRATPSGFGLVGLAERTELAHGRFEYGPTADGDFVLRAWLPWGT